MLGPRLVFHFFIFIRESVDSLCRDGANVQYSPIAKTFGRGVTWMSDVYVYMHKHAPTGNLLKLDTLRLLLRDRSRAVVATCMARGVLDAIFGCPRLRLLCQLTFNFHERRY